MHIKRSRVDYWSCTKLADKIRGTEKPFAASLKDWRDWRADAKKAHPIRYIIAEEGLDTFQDIVFFIPDIYNTAHSYIKNRFKDKIQYLDTGLTPGQYSDLDYRITHALKNEFIKFVEGEFARNYSERGDVYAAFRWMSSNHEMHGDSWEKLKAVYTYFKYQEKVLLNELDDISMADIKGYQQKSQEIENNETFYLKILIEERRMLWT